MSGIRDIAHLDPSLRRSGCQVPVLVRVLVPVLVQYVGSLRIAGEVTVVRQETVGSGALFRAGH